MTDAPDADGHHPYQRQLLGLLGDDDPAAVQAATPAALRELVEGASQVLRDRPEPGEWSVLELIAHIADAEIVSSARYRWILAHDTPVIQAYDQDLWVDRLRPNEMDPDEVLAPFDALRRANVALWERTPVADRERYGLHEERGRESYGLLFRMMAGHDRFHLDQARATLETILERGDA